MTSARGTDDEKEARWWPGAGDDDSDGGLKTFLEGESMIAKLYRPGRAYRITSSKRREKRGGTKRDEAMIVAHSTRRGSGGSDHEAEAGIDIGEARGRKD